MFNKIYGFLRMLEPKVFAGGSATLPKPVAQDKLSPELGRWTSYIRDHPDALRPAVVAEIGGEGEDAGAELRLLIERGHVLLLSDQRLICA